MSGSCQRMGTKTPYFFGPMVAASCRSAWQNMTSFSDKLLKVLARCLNSDMANGRPKVLFTWYTSAVSGEGML